MRHGTHFCTMNSDGSSRITRLTNTPPADRSTSGYDPEFSRLIARWARLELERRKAAQFDFVRDVLVGPDSILDD